MTTTKGLVAIWLALLVLPPFGCARTSGVSQQALLPAAQETSSANGSGIKIESVRVTAAGHLLDFRYRVTDPDKAAAVFDRENKAFLIDQATGNALGVPRMAKVGPLRQTNFEPDPNRVYFILFSNSAGLVEPGSLVTLSVGDYRVEDILVH